MANASQVKDSSLQVLEQIKEDVFVPFFHKLLEYRIFLEVRRVIDMLTFHGWTDQIILHISVAYEKVLKIIEEHRAERPSVIKFKYCMCLHVIKVFVHCLR